MFSMVVNTGEENRKISRTYLWLVSVQKSYFISYQDHVRGSRVAAWKPSQDLLPFAGTDVVKHWVMVHSYKFTCCTFVVGACHQGGHQPRQWSYERPAGDAEEPEASQLALQEADSPVRRGTVAAVVTRNCPHLASQSIASNQKDQGRNDEESRTIVEIFPHLTRTPECGRGKQLLPAKSQRSN